jgi:hypothetical protein
VPAKCPDDRDQIGMAEILEVYHLADAADRLAQFHHALVQ